MPRYSSSVRRGRKGTVTSTFFVGILSGISCKLGLDIHAKQFVNTAASFWRQECLSALADKHAGDAVHQGATRCINLMVQHETKLEDMLAEKLRLNPGTNREKAVNRMIQAKRGMRA